MKPILYYTLSNTPIGPLTLVTREHHLCGIYFANHKHPPTLHLYNEKESDTFHKATQCLEAYFQKKAPPPMPSIEFLGGTSFQKKVWRALQTISPGETLSYQEVANLIESPQAVRAVGAAIGRNPISILIPCHRVVGKNGSLTGFAGGVERKRWLLEHEQKHKQTTML